MHPAVPSAIVAICVAVYELCACSQQLCALVSFVTILRTEQHTNEFVVRL